MESGERGKIGKVRREDIWKYGEGSAKSEEW